MSAEQTTAIVLRTIEFSETSLIVTLLTREFGRVTAIAKGARRPKGPFEGSLDLLAVCRVVVIRKTSDALDLLTEAKLHRRFRGGQKSLPRLYAGYHVAEMLRLLTDDHDPHPDVYDLTIQTLQQIDGAGDIPSTLLYFDAQLLRLLGHAPGTDRCTDCGGRVSDGPRLAFSLSAGGLVCDGCRPKQRQLMSVAPAIVAQLRRLQSSDTLLPLELPPECYGELRAVMNRYIQTVVHCIPKMQAYLTTAIKPTA
jgi:DNA repair protein RecO (recombination protein O)